MMGKSKNDSDLVRQGIAAFKAHQPAQALPLFEKALEQDPKNQLAWLWLAGCTSCAQEKRKYLLCALDINPNNDIGRRASAGLVQLDKASQPAPDQQLNAAPQAPALVQRAARPPEPPASLPPTAGNSQSPSSPSRTTAGSSLPFLVGQDYFQSAGRDFFLFYQANTAFVTGRAQYPLCEPGPNHGRDLLGQVLAVGFMTLVLSVPPLIVALSVWLEMLMTALLDEPVSLALIPMTNNDERLAISLVALFLTAVMVAVFSNDLAEYLDYRRSPPKTWVLQGKVVSFRQHYDEDGDIHINITYRFTHLDGRVETACSGYSGRHGLRTDEPQPGTPVLVWYSDRKSTERRNYDIL
jgi:tetratricopeptide (TPR) repeat protein